MNIKFIAALLLVFPFSSMCFALSENPGTAAISIVKNHPNNLGTPCREVPKAVEQMIKYKDSLYNSKSTISDIWQAAPDGSKYTVTLSFAIDTSFTVDTVSVGYAWHPKFAWVVDIKNKSVSAANAMTQIWMGTGKIRTP